MASTDSTQSRDEKQRGASDQEENLGEELCKELTLSLPREKGWRTSYLYLFQGFWCTSNAVETISTFQKQFQAKESDVIVASFPKSGTTWLKALAFAVVNRREFPSSSDNHPLLTSNSHNLVPFFEEISVYDHNSPRPDRDSFVSLMTERRLFGTHIPFPSLAESIKEPNSKCKIVYICRNPFDTFVSLWTMINKVIKQESSPALTIEEAFERYCEGVSPFGPIWDNMLGYWKESIARPDKVLFLKYEDMKEDAEFHAKRMAEFLGCPFAPEEESNGVIEDIVKLCSFEKMKDLEVNKSGTAGMNVDNKLFFRKGQVGDWVNYLSSSMVEKLSKVIEEKLSGSGLSLRGCS